MKKVYRLILVCVATFMLMGCGSSSSLEADQEVSEVDEIDQEDVEEIEDFDYRSVSMKQTTSTMIAEEGYDRDFDTLLIRFRTTGALYAYYDVPYEVFDELSEAESQGSYFNKYIKDMYEYEQLETGEGYEVVPLYHITTKEKASYAVNKGNFKFHKMSCKYASDQYDVDYVSDSKEELEELGCIACKICKP